MKYTSKELVLVGLFTSLTAIMAQLTVKIPFSPVPITGQILAVCLSGAILGSKCGTASQVIYLLLGLFGVPVFSGFNAGPGYVLGPTGGYLVSFPIAAFVIGSIIERRKQTTVGMMLVAMLAGLTACYAIGTAWLGAVLKLSPGKALIAGIGWYLPLDIIKVSFASFISCHVRNLLIKSSLLEV